MPASRVNWRFSVLRPSNAQFLFAFLAVHDVAYRRTAVHELLNRAPLFWNTCLAALQTSDFIALGRVSDSDSLHNVNQLLRLAQDNRTQLFSKAALARRKQAASSNAHERLGEYLRYVAEPSAGDDFRRIRKLMARWRRTYEAHYRDVRHRLLAHKEAQSSLKSRRCSAKACLLNVETARNPVCIVSDLRAALATGFMNTPGRLDAVCQR